MKIAAKRRLTRWLCVALILVSIAGYVVFPILWQRLTVYTMKTYLPDSDRFVYYHCKRFGARRNEMHGPFTEYFWREGPIAIEGGYRDGAMDGLWTYWNDRGEIVLQQNYEAGHMREERNTPPWW